MIHFKIYKPVEKKKKRHSLSNLIESITTSASSCAQFEQGARAELQNTSEIPWGV